jgi:lysophospholipase L1-like esterase
MNLNSPAAGPEPGGRAQHKRRSRWLTRKFLALSLAGATLMGGAALVVPQFQDKADAAGQVHEVSWKLGDGPDGATAYGAFIKSLQDPLGKGQLVVDSDGKRRSVITTDPESDQTADIEIVPQLGTVLHAEVNLSNLYVTRFSCMDSNLADNTPGLEYKLDGKGANNSKTTTSLPEGYDALSSKNYADRQMTAVQLGHQAFDNAVQAMCPGSGKRPPLKEAAKAAQTLIVGISEATRIRQIAAAGGKAIHAWQSHPLSGEDVNAMRSWGKMSDLYRNKPEAVPVTVYGRPVNNGRDAARILMVALGGDTPSDQPSAGATAAPSAPVEQPERKDYVALGDSFSAGTGAGPYLPNDGSIKAPGPDLKVINPPASVNSSNNCQRSEQAYGPRTAKEYGGPEGFIGSFTFAACAGAVSQDVVDKQLEALSADTDLVTLTIGGNDVKFATAMTTCAAPEPWAEACGIALNRSVKNMRNPQLVRQLAATYEKILAAAPNARLIVPGYPKLFDVNASCTFTQNRFNPYPEVRKQMNAAAVELNKVIQDAVKQAGGRARFLDPQPLFDGHGICDPDPFLTDPGTVGASALKDSYHPNTKGHQAYASLLARALGA